MEWTPNLEDSSSGSSASPRTQEDLPLGTSKRGKARTVSAGWDLPPLGGFRHDNGLELYDGGWGSRFSFTGEGFADENAFAFDQLGELDPPLEPGPDSYAAEKNTHAPYSSAFDQIGMSEDLAAPMFNPSRSGNSNGLVAPAWSSYVDPSDLLGGAAAGGHLDEFEAKASEQPLDSDNWLPKELNVSQSVGSSPVASTSAFSPPKLKRRVKDVSLPPVASSADELTGPFGLLVLGLKADPYAEAGRTYHSRVETSLRLNLVLAAGPRSGPKYEEDAPFGSVPDYADESGALRPHLIEGLRRVAGYQYIKLDKSSPVFKRGYFEPPPTETLYLESHIYFAAQPNQVVPLQHSETRCSARESKGCIPREMKRWSERISGNRRSQADAKEELLSRLEADEATTHFQQWVEEAEAMMFNDAEVQDFSEGCTSVQLRILHYARCFSAERQQGYYIVFTVRNHLGQILATGATPSIFMTDNHKGSSSRASVQHSPVDSGLEELSATSSRGSRRSTAGSTGRRSGAGQSARSARRTSSTDSKESRSSRTKRTADPPSSESKRRKSSGFASRSSLSMTPRDPILSGIASPSAIQHELSAPASPGALAAQLARMPQANRETSPSTETSSSAFSPPPNDILAGLQHAEQQAPLIPPQRSRVVRPHIEDVIPTQGSIRGGGRIAVIGTGFRQGAVVYFGLTPSQTEYRGSTSLVCLLPPAPFAGPVHVNFGTDAPEDPLFTYLDDAEQVLTSQSVSVVAAMLGLTSLDLSQRFDEIRRSGQSNGLTSPKPASTSPSMMQRKAGLQMTRSRRASIGESENSPSRPPYMTAHGRTKSLTDLTNLDVPPPPARRKKEATTAVQMSTETMLISLYELPSRRISPAVFSETINRHTTAEGQTVLHLACILGYSQLVQALIARGGLLDSVDANGMMPLHFAALHARIQVIHVLIDAGAPTQMRNGEGLTPYKIAERVIEREDVMDAFPLQSRSRSISSSQSSLYSYFASGSDYSDSVGDSQEEDELDDDSDRGRGSDDDDDDDGSEFVAKGPVPAPSDRVKSDDEDTLVETASAKTARPPPGKNSSKWFSIDSESTFWSPISTAWWQPRRAAEAPEAFAGPPAPRMYGPSEATLVNEKILGKTLKSQAVLSRRLGYDADSSTALSAAPSVSFQRIKKQSSLRHDRKLFLIYIPALLLAMAYFLHSASMLPASLEFVELLIPRAILNMR